VLSRFDQRQEVAAAVSSQSDTCPQCLQWRRLLDCFFRAKGSPPHRKGGRAQHRARQEVDPHDPAPDKLRPPKFLFKGICCSSPFEESKNGDT
jgi:hypothetical protein